MVDVHERALSANLISHTGVRVTSNYDSDLQSDIGLSAIIGVVTLDHVPRIVHIASDDAQLTPRQPAARPSMREIFDETQAKFPVIMARLAE